MSASRATRTSASSKPWGKLHFLSLLTFLVLQIIFFPISCHPVNPAFFSSMSSFPLSTCLLPSILSSSSYPAIIILHLFRFLKVSLKQCCGFASRSGSASVGFICFWASRIRIRIRSGPFHHQAKKVRKTLISTVLWLYDFEEWCKCPSVPVCFGASRIRIWIHLSEVPVRIRGSRSASGFVPKCHRSATVLWSVPCILPWENQRKSVFWIRICFNADPDPAFCLSADPDPGSQTDGDPDPGQTFPSQKVKFLQVKYVLSRYRNRS